MFRLALEGYLLMFVTFLNLGILTCDEDCILPVTIIKKFLPEMVTELTNNFLMMLDINVFTAQILAQFLIIGDVFIGILVVVKFFGAILKRFVLMFATLILSIMALQRLKLI